ncbi:MAG: LysM peptidoglycan-binding domain-containing protein [Treponema sp.]|jgi:hypothetical protein|nr:LysM peptidoglycan-binding domain-containing protein [Treponema sp.]
MASTIGIKLANGVFYSILEENSKIKRRLILTTVHDNQESMQIDLYRSFSQSMADGLYMGSIVVENIKPKPKGEPSVELIIACNPGDKITADAMDLDPSANGEHLHLSVSLKSLEWDNREMEFTDFDFPEPPPEGLYEKNISAIGRYGLQGFPGIIFVIMGVLIILLGFELWFFVYWNRGNQNAVEMAAAQAQPDFPDASVPEMSAIQPPIEQARTAVPVIEAPQVSSPGLAAAESPAASAGSRKPDPPVASFNVPANIPRDGYPYRIRWGDTLWDISDAFYRNPWLYPRIARFNSIRNPDIIIAGKIIRIPPRN